MWAKNKKIKGNISHFRKEGDIKLNGVREGFRGPSKEKAQWLATKKNDYAEKKNNNNKQAMVVCQEKKYLNGFSEI